MNLYKITVRPLLSYCSPLQSDTFFGAFCWSFLYEYGETALRNLISNYKNRKPDIIFSNAFPSGRLPMPAGMDAPCKSRDAGTTKQERYQKYIADKKKKQSGTVPLDVFNKLIDGSMESVLDEDVTGTAPETEVSLEWRNLVSRQTDTVDNIDGAGNLFGTKQYFTEGFFDIYMYSSFERARLEKVLKGMFRYGIGAQRSVGKGAFEMTGEVEIFSGFQIPRNPDAFIALSNFIPHPDDPVEGWYKAFVKYPKVSFTDSPEDSPFKKPVIFLKAGSVFTDQPVKKFYGSCIENIALKDGKVSDEIVIGAYTIAVPCCLGRRNNMGA